MKRYVYVAQMAALVVILSALPLHEAAAGMDYEFGFKCGLSMGKITGADTEGIVSIEDYDVTLSGEFNDYRMGFVGGVYFMVHFTDMLGLRLEGLYAMKGGKGTVDGTIVDPGYGEVPFSADVIFKFNYVEIPLLAALRVPIDENVRFNAVAGPAFAFNMAAKLNMELGVMGYFIDQTEDIDDEVKGTDIGGVIGGGFEFDAGQVSLFVEGRWTFGFSSIDDSGEDLDVKNSALSFSGGIAIPLGASGGE